MYLDYKSYTYGINMYKCIIRVHACMYEPAMYSMTKVSLSTADCSRHFTALRASSHSTPFFNNVIILQQAVSLYGGEGRGGNLWILGLYAAVGHNSSFGETGGLNFPQKLFLTPRHPSIHTPT